MIPLSYSEEGPAEFHDVIRRMEQETRSRMVGHAVGTEALLVSLMLMLVRGRAAKTSRGLKWPLYESQTGILGQLRFAGPKCQRQWPWRPPPQPQPMLMLV